MALLEAFTGTVYHQLDDKGRVRIPSKFFPKTGEEDEADEKSEKNLVMKFYFMAGSQGCISVYMKEELDVRLQAMYEIPNTPKSAMAKRKILSSIEKVETDKQGRVVIPPTLRAYARINKELITVGMYDHFEIWAKEVYEPMDSTISFAGASDEVGIF